MQIPENIASYSLPKQFLITPDPIEPPSGWRSIRLGDHWLLASPELPVTRLIDTSPDANPQDMCVVLGWFVVNGVMCPNQRSQTLQTDVPVERLYFDMTGRFLILCAGETGLRCTTDPGALLPVVYRPETGEAASTPAALSLTAAVRMDAEKQASFERPDATTWYPFGVTPFAGIQRVLPGSTVELPSGRLTRVAEPPFRLFKPVEIVEYIHTWTRDFVNALGAGGALECHLTAGWDSRMVLSACLGSASEVEYLTYLVPGTNGKIDSLVAQRIARALSLRHREIAMRPTRQSDTEDWLRRTSGCVEDAVMNLSTTVVSSNTDSYVLCGLAGEVGRAFYWQARDVGKIGIGAEDLLRRLGFAASQPAAELAEQWLNPLLGRSTPAILDQAYIDLRLGGWAGPSVYGHPVSKPTLSPFNNATIFSLMRMLPEKYRHSGQFARDFVALGSPTLAQIPVNRATGLNRIRFAKREIAALIPKSTRASLRALVAR